MGRRQLQPHHRESEEDGEAISTTLGTFSGERAAAAAAAVVVERGAHGGWTTAPRCGVVVLLLVLLPIMTAVLTGLLVGGISAQDAAVETHHQFAAVETPRDLCLQAIQAAVVDRTRDLFEPVYLPHGRQRPHVLYQLAEHGNYGDTFIDRGEEQLLARVGLEAAAECSLAFVRGSMMVVCEDQEVEDLLQGNATVMFSGGGNWGNLWPRAHQYRMRDLEMLSIRPDMNLVTMPNSLKFKTKAARKVDETNVAAIVAAKHPTTRITFLFRQQDSYDTAKSMYPDVDVRLVPDVAFMIGPLLRAGPEKFKYDILFLARRSGEGALNKSGLKKIGEEMARMAPDLTYFVGDWGDNPTNGELLYEHLVQETNVPSLRHGAVVDAAVRYFSTAKVVISDRLHASILALLLDIPHVVVDGGPDSASYGKRLMTRAVAFETSEHCTETSLRYRMATTLVDGIPAGLALLDEFFGES